jgi:hypothetical protein
VITVIITKKMQRTIIGYRSKTIMKKILKFHTPLSGNQSGGVIIRSIIIIVTLCLVGFSIYTLLHNFGQKQQTAHRKALAISEYGLMIALQHLPLSPAEIKEIKKTAYDEGWYNVTFNTFSRNDTTFCTISSTGHFGAVKEKRSCQVRLNVSPGDTSWIRERMF